MALDSRGIHFYVHALTGGPNGRIASRSRSGSRLPPTYGSAGVARRIDEGEGEQRQSRRGQRRVGPTVHN